MSSHSTLISKTILYVIPHLSLLKSIGEDVLKIPCVLTTDNMICYNSWVHNFDSLAQGAAAHTFSDGSL